MPVYHQYFPMVPIIIVSGNKRGYRCKSLTPDSQCLQPLWIIMRQQCKFAGSVIHQPDVYSLGSLLCQYFQYPAPHKPFVYNKIFHKNKMLGFFKLFQHLFKLILAQREISHRCIRKHRVASAPVHIMGQCRHAFILFPQSGHNILRLRNLFFCIHYHIIDTLLQRPMPNIALGIQEQKHTKHRKKHNCNQPCDFRRRVNLAIEQINYHHNSK